MATNTNSDLATKQAAAKMDPSAGVINMDDALGVILFATAVVTLPASPSQNDTITIVPAALVPVGAVVVPQLCAVYIVGDPGTTMTITVGPTSDPDLFAVALDCKAGGMIRFTEGTAPAGIATPYRFTTQEAILATYSAVGTNASRTAVFTIAYRAKA